MKFPYNHFQLRVKCNWLSVSLAFSTGLTGNLAPHFSIVFGLESNPIEEAVTPDRTPLLSSFSSSHVAHLRTFFESILVSPLSLLFRRGVLELCSELSPLVLWQNSPSFCAWKPQASQARSQVQFGLIWLTVIDKRGATDTSPRFRRLQIRLSPAAIASFCHAVRVAQFVDRGFW